MDEEIKKTSEENIPDFSEFNIEDETGETLPRKKRIRYDFYVELILFFILGVLLGVAVKTEAAKKITIGFNDYKMKIQSQDYDVNQIQKDLMQKAMQTQGGAGSGPQDQNAGGDTSNSDQNTGTPAAGSGTNSQAGTGGN